jgi:hypothetical protein
MDPSGEVDPIPEPDTIAEVDPITEADLITEMDPIADINPPFLQFRRIGTLKRFPAFSWNPKFNHLLYASFTRYL